MGRAANQNVNDSCEFTVTGSHLIDLDRQAAGVASAIGARAVSTRAAQSPQQANHPCRFVRAPWLRRRRTRRGLGDCLR